MLLSQTTRQQLPVLEGSIRHWRYQNNSLEVTESVQKRRVEREATRLLSLVTALREEMSRVGIEKLNAVNAALPFIEVVRSAATATEVKSTAVECLERIVSVLSNEDDGAVEALSAVTEAILECRFEQTDTGADEVAMIWLLEALASCSRLSGVGGLLSDEILFRVIETMYDACTAPFNSDTTRAVALRLTSIFLRELFSTASFGSENNNTRKENQRSEDEEETEPGVENDISTPLQSTTLAARRAFAFLVEMADPENSQNIPAIGSWGRFVALRLLVECVSASRGEDEVIRIVKDNFLLEIIKDGLLRTLVQTVQTVGNNSPMNPIFSSSVSSSSSPAGGAGSTNSTSLEKQLEEPHRMVIIVESLRLTNLLLGSPSSRRELKAQFECFFNAVYARVLERSASRRIVRMDEAILVIESLCDLLSDPTLLCDCFVSYDLHLQSTDVFENNFKLFSRLAFPHQLSVPALDGFRLLSLRGLLAALRALSIPKNVVEDEEIAKEEEEHAREVKLRKLALQRCAEAFNTKPKLGIQALMEEGVLSKPPDPLVLASFLRNTPTLEKVGIGQFLGEDAELNKAVLRSFTETFDLRNRSLVSSLRTFLECFRLPKEAQQIDRIVQAFADVAMVQCADASYFPTVDACYILCFAIIMLNTDLHNRNIRPEKKMTAVQFAQNNRNYGNEVSKGVNIPDQYLNSIYVEISKREINTMKDGSSLTAEVSRDRWHDVLARSRGEAKLNSKSIRENSLDFGYKKVMFETIWKPALAAVSVVFDSGQASEQPDALHSAIDGFLTLAKAAARFRCREAFDSVVAALCKFTSLLMYGSDSSSPIVDLVEGSRPFNNAVRDFGNNHKGQMAAMSVFALTRRFGSDIRKAWKHVLWCVLRLQDLKLLSECYLEEKDILDSSARSLFHRKVRESCIKSHGMKKSGSDKSSSRGLASPDTPSGWGFTNWFFGGENEDENSKAAMKLETDEEHRALMSALKVADEFCSIKKLGSPSPHHHERHFESSDVLEDEILTRVEEHNPAVTSYASECVKSCRPLSVIYDSKNLSDESLNALLDAHFQALGPGVVSEQTNSTSSSSSSAVAVGGGGGDDLGVDLIAAPSSGSRLVVIHFLSQIVLLNPTRFQLIWPRVSKSFFEILKSSKQPSFLVEICIVGLLQICCKMFKQAPGDLIVTLQKMVEFFPIAPGMDFLLGRVVLDLISDTELFWEGGFPGGSPLCGWEELFVLLECLASASNVSASFAFDALKFVSNSETRNVLNCARSATSFALIKWPQGEQTQRETAVIDFIYSLIDKTKTSNKSENFVQDTWIPLLRELALIAQSEPVAGQSKKRALTLLLRSCLSDEEKDNRDGQVWANILQVIVFPVCQFSLRDGENGSSSPLLKGGETKLMIAACDVLAKMLLAFGKSLSTLDNFSELWMEVLQFLERFKQAGLIRASSGETDGNFLSEIVTELLKNLLLSLYNEGILSEKARIVATGQLETIDGKEEPQAAVNSRASLLWELSWSVLDRSPGLKSELYLLDDQIDLREDENISNIQEVVVSIENNNTIEKQDSTTTSQEEGEDVLTQVVEETIENISASEEEEQAIQQEENDDDDDHPQETENISASEEEEEQAIQQEENDDDDDHPQETENISATEKEEEEQQAIQKEENDDRKQTEQQQQQVDDVVLVEDPVKE